MRDLSADRALLSINTATLRPWSLEQVYETFPRLRERKRFPGTKLSGGEQQMLALARVLRMGARLLLCDEPTEGLSPLIVQQIGAILREVKGQGVTVLLIEQNVHFASTVARRVSFSVLSVGSPPAASRNSWTTMTYQSEASTELYSGSWPESGKRLGNIPSETRPAHCTRISRASANLPVAMQRPRMAMNVSRPQSPNHG